MIYDWHVDAKVTISNGIEPFVWFKTEIKVKGHVIMPK